MKIKVAGLMQLKNTQIKKSFIIGLVFLMAGAIMPLSFAYSESLNGYTANGTVSTSSTSFGTVASVTVPASATARNILVTASFSSAATNNLSSDKSLQFNLTDGAVNNTMNMTLRGVGGGGADSRSGQIVNLFTSVSAAATYSIQHNVGSSADQIQTQAVITAIPLLTTQNTVALAGSGARQTTQQSVSGATFTAIPETTITVDTATPGYSNIPGDFFVIASLEDYRTSGSGKDTGEWQFQYSSDGGAVWNSFGHSTRQAILASNKSGIIKIADVLTNQTPSANYQFRLVHRVETGSSTIYSNNINIIAVFTGIEVSGNNLNFPTYSAYVGFVQTTSTSLTESVGYSFSRPDINTDLFIYSRCYMSMSGNDAALCDIFLDPNPTFTPIVHDRYIVNTNDVGSQGHVGLATDLSAGTAYRASMRDATGSGKTMASNDLIIILWDLNTAALQADLSVSKASEMLIPGQAGVLAYTVTVTNNGPDTSPTVSVTDTLPAGLNNATWNLDSSDQGSWTGSALLGGMNSGVSHTIEIFADVDPLITSVDDNAVSVFDPDIYDPIPANNSATCSTGFIPGPTVLRRALNFITGTDSNVAVAANSSLDLTTMGTLEAWIHPMEFIDDAGIVMKGTSAACYGFGLGGGSLFSGGTSQNIGFVLYDNTGAKYLLTADTDPLIANKWYHIACVWDLGASPQMAIYINGIKEAEGSPAIADVRTNTEDLMIGFQDISSAEFAGVIDEVRIWDAARIQTRIQETMCHTITASEPDYADLTGNWRFDEDSGAVCSDASGQGNIGIITNAERICSTAPVGDASIPDYDDADGFSVVFANPAQDDRLTVSKDEGDWSVPLKSGLQVYRVDTAADDQNGPLGLRLLNDGGYWGVFITGGTGPTYTIEYNYDVSDDGFPGIGNNDNLQLTYRHGNCENWKNLDATPGANILTRNGLAGTEFILGTSVDPRNAINFDSANSNYVVVTDGVAGGDLDPTTYGAVEAWINISSYQDNAGIIHKGNGTNDSYSLYMGSGVSGNLICFTVDDGVTPATINSTTTLNLDTWYHIAGTWDDAADTMTLYINGVQEASGTTVAAQDTSGDLYIGVRQTGGPSYFNGYIDEVRIWNITAAANLRTRTLIRDTMCKKLTGSETDLGACWRFDEETGSITCPDYSGNGHAGTMTNFGADGSDAIRGARVCSSAPIGDDSAYNYYDAGPGPVSAQMAHSDGDYMFGTESTGTWTGQFSGIQIYLLNEPPIYPPDFWVTPDPPYSYQTPNGLTPPAGWSSIDYYRYWGVFVTDWDDVTNQPAYDVVYYYTGNPSVPVDDSVVALARRPGYCFGTWADSGYVLDYLINNTLTVTGDSQFGPPATNPEYVLGGKDAPLAIILASFTAGVDDSGDCIEITWETATEIDTPGFYLWRSDRKDGLYTRIDGSFTRSEALAETMGAAYDYLDCDVDVNAGGYYYKLEEIDFDGTKDNPFYGPIGPVAQIIGASQAVNNESGNSKGSGCFIDVIAE